MQQRGLLLHRYLAQNCVKAGRRCLPNAALYLNPPFLLESFNGYWPYTRREWQAVVKGHDCCALGMCRDVWQPRPQPTSPYFYAELLGSSPNSRFASLKCNGDMLDQFSVTGELP
ncbi:hypothetical protein [Bradyrhizobium sp. RDM4]|uniref:hypothetical protein n=1 Tax=Bradyrhizobium sp. RDM4 TaxID=3378765 RepID=UPI0038FD112B